MIAPGATAALHDGALEPARGVTLHLRPHGYTHCDSIAMPAMPPRPRLNNPSAAAGPGQGHSGADALAARQPPLPPPWVATRDVFPVERSRRRGACGRGLHSSIFQLIVSRF